MIKDRFPISIYYGLVTLILTYAVCIPLGLVKAVRHRTAVDTASSIFIFIGYAVPGHALGSLLLLFSQSAWIGSPWAALWMELRHADAHRTVVGHHPPLHSAAHLLHHWQLALVTMLLKNHLLDNLAADYIRTAIAKGVSFKQAAGATRSATR